MDAPDAWCAKQVKYYAVHVRTTLEFLLRDIGAREAERAAGLSMPRAGDGGISKALRDISVRVSTLCRIPESLDLQSQFATVVHAYWQTVYDRIIPFVDPSSSSQPEAGLDSLVENLRSEHELLAAYATSILINRPPTPRVQGFVNDYLRRDPNGDEGPMVSLAEIDTNAFFVSSAGFVALVNLATGNGYTGAYLKNLRRDQRKGVKMPRNTGGQLPEFVRRGATDYCSLQDAVAWSNAHKQCLQKVERLSKGFMDTYVLPRTLLPLGEETPGNPPVSFAATRETPADHPPRKAR